jgi:Na+/H+ antiporter NhaD/arsenite permease-like protein
MEHAAFIPEPVWIAPFAILLIGIAVLPLAAPHFWEPNRNKLLVSAIFGIPVLGVYLTHTPGTVLETAQDYLSFMILLGGLYVISGGIRIHGDLEATPTVNTAFLAGGALLASLIGTTGASMLLIRPLLQTNSERTRVVHTVVFFIFIVSNIGGSLTPLGDPPLFLGYLRGVPFTWTFRLAPAWLFTVAILLVIYFLWDKEQHARESFGRRRADHERQRSLHIHGEENFVYLAGLIAVAAFLKNPIRDVAMVALAGMSLWRTPSGLRHANHFTFGPILEVAALFAGIFATMMPALDILRTYGAGLGVREPWQFFWATGGLSSFLDNAPTYLTFLSLAQGLGLPAEVVGIPHATLAAISLGAVFMGANTYIGNGPNFMVRAIAEHRGVKMPSFGGYMVYSGLVLIPVFVLVTLVFLR